MSGEIVVGGKYRHFKGADKLYRVLNLAVNCDDLSEVVVYEQLYETPDFPQGTIWTRSLEDFCGFKEFEDGSRVKRFELVE